MHNKYWACWGVNTEFWFGVHFGFIKGRYWVWFSQYKIWLKVIFSFICGLYQAWFCLILDLIRGLYRSWIGKQTILDCLNPNIIGCDYLNLNLIISCKTFQMIQWFTCNPQWVFVVCLVTRNCKYTGSNLNRLDHFFPLLFCQITKY